MPLGGRRVLVTRAVEDAGEWAARLATLGADPVVLPCIRVETFTDEPTRARLATALRDADWLCVTSPRGAEAVERLAGPLATATRVAAVGEATAGAVRSLLGRTPFVSREGTSLALGEELLAQELVRAADRVVIAAAEGGRTDAERVLRRGGARVTRIDVYRTVPAPPNAARIDLARENIGDVLLASPSAVQGLLNLASSPASARIFTIGPTTTAAVVAAGLSVCGEAMHPDLDSLVEAMQ
jgi:uroporphyrinogen-III synthase/uroporphyrinogen III methyltransferase/synthase